MGNLKNIHPANISVKDFSYNLPEEKIAKYPLERRDQSKLLVWQNGKISDQVFNELPQLLPANSTLFFNNTKVIRARLLFQKETGANIEIFCLDPFEPSDYQIAFQETEKCTWHCMIGNQKKWKSGILKRFLEIDGQTIILSAEKIETSDKKLVKFSWDNADFEFSRIIEHAGILPIPPYLNRNTEESDLTRYQTVYSKIKGSVAAPTAGLHFTENVFEKLREAGHKTAELTLHVGAGTFQPVKSETIEGHEMHSEQIYITRELISQIRDCEYCTIAVGTTTIRTLESIYWLGYQVASKEITDIENLKVSQWEPYATKNEISVDESLNALLKLMDIHKTDHLSVSTQIIIAPGYEFKIIDGMLTNFHQPQSTLLLLISAFLGESWKTIYDHALQNEYRFLSYGDSNLYLK